MSKITNVLARQILDSRGNPTLEATVTLDSGITATASCPSGASTGTHEALELRDDDLGSYNGKGVLKAVANITRLIAPALLNKNYQDVQTIDKEIIALDGTPNKSKLGANALLVVSIACTKALAASENMPVYRYIASIVQENAELKIPTPLSNLINGGLHAGGNLDMQEFIAIPTGFSSFSQQMESVVLVYSVLKKLLVEKGFQTLIGDEGGFAPKLATNQEALDLLSTAVSTAGYKPGENIMLGIDVAASTFFKDGMYQIKDLEKSVTSSELGTFYKELIEKYHLLYLEDPFAEDDLVGWASFTTTAPEGTIVTGDDLVCTNMDRLTMALEKQMIRGIIIKPNQIGTITETIHVVKKAKTAGLKIAVSHRSGETTDDFLADLAVGVGANFAKFGAPARGERVVKYNRLLQIEQELQK